MDFSEYNDMPNAETNLRYMMKDYSIWLDGEDEIIEDTLIDDDTIYNLLKEASYSLRVGCSQRAFKILLGLTYLTDIPQTFYKEIIRHIICGYTTSAADMIQQYANTY
jgi:hypothetical protein